MYKRYYLNIIPGAKEQKELNYGTKKRAGFTSWCMSRQHRNSPTKGKIKLYFQFPL